MTHGELTQRLYRGEIYPVQGREVLTATYYKRYELVRYARMLEGQGKIQIVGPPRWSEKHFEWQLPVHRIAMPDTPPRIPRWAWMTAGIASVVGAFLGLLWWVLTSLATVPFVAFTVAVLAGLAFLVRLGHSKVTVETTTKVTVRRW